MSSPPKKQTQIVMLRKTAIGGSADTDVVWCPPFDNCYLYAVEITNVNRADLVDVYLRADGSQDANSCALIPRSLTVGAIYSVCWSGRIPVKYPMGISGEWINAVAGDVLYLKVIMGFE